MAGGQGPCRNAERARKRGYLLTFPFFALSFCPRSMSSSSPCLSARLPALPGRDVLSPSLCLPVRKAREQTNGFHRSPKGTAFLPSAPFPSPPSVHADLSPAPQSAAARRPRLVALRRLPQRPRSAPAPHRHAAAAESNRPSQSEICQERVGRYVTSRSAPPLLWPMYGNDIEGSPSYAVPQSRTPACALCVHALQGIPVEQPMAHSLPTPSLLEMFAHMPIHPSISPTNLKRRFVWVYCRALPGSPPLGPNRRALHACSVLGVRT